MNLAAGYFGYWCDYLLWWGIFLSVVIHTWCFFRFFPRSRWPRAGLFLGNALVFVCLLGSLMLVAESYLRFAYVATDSFGMSLPAKRWFALHTRLNSQGCRDPEWTPVKPLGVRRMAFVGDSFTYGWGIERVEDRFSNLIQKRLSKKGMAVEVLNVAKPGWNTGDEIQPIKDMIDVYHVDEIVLCHVSNDIEDLIGRTATFDPKASPEPSWFNIASTCLGDYLYRRLFLGRSPLVRDYFEELTRAYDNPAVSAKHHERLQVVIDVCRERGVTLRVVLLPQIQDLGDGVGQTALHDRLGNWFRERGVDTVDLHSALEGEERGALVVNGLDAHPNGRAHQLFGEAIWKAFYQEPR